MRRSRPLSRIVQDYLAELLKTTSLSCSRSPSCVAQECFVVLLKITQCSCPRLLVLLEAALLLSRGRTFPADHLCHVS